MALPGLAWVCSFPVRHEFELPAEEHDGHAECFCVTIAATGSSDGHKDKNKAGVGNRPDGPHKKGKRHFHDPEHLDKKDKPNRHGGNF